jgi:uncharacterized damage-inducible protein DinB
MARSMEEISKLLDYNKWANGRTLESVSVLTPEELDRQLGGSFPSVRETLAHIYAAEWIWLERWRGTSPPALPASHDLSTLEALRSKLERVEQERRAFARGLSDARLSEVLAYSNLAGEAKKNLLGELVVHLVNHSTYHRGQVATMLRQLDRKPLATDYVLFLDTGGK